MTRARLGGVLLLLLSSGIFISWGAALERTALYGMIDFKAVYYGTRCLLQHCDPYQESELQDSYLAAGGESSPKFAQLRRSVTLWVYLPTASSFVALFAMLPWGLAHVLWMILMASCLILAAFLMWDLGAKRAPGVSIFLACMVLANCEFVFAVGNSAGIVVSLCVVAAWCFLQERFVPAGVLCLAVSLAVKPHDAGLVWLYFLLAGGVYRKRALQTLVVTLVLSLPAVLWITHVAPNWVPELRANLSANSAPGSLSDPRGANFDGRLPYTVIDLQTVITPFRDDPRVYDLVSYLICAPLLLVWMFVTVRSRSSPATAWLALAAIAALTMLPVYHRPYDTKLLLLSIPACAMLWAEGGLIRWLALLFTSAGVVLTGDIPLIVLRLLTRNFNMSAAGLFGKIVTVAVIRPIPPILLTMGIFYLWVYVRRTYAPVAERGSQ